ncbi:MAG: cation:proton antiporter, partial [Acidimicrobiales bacterium]
MAEPASAARLATVVGAFVAGLSLARTGEAERIRRELTPVGHLFVPVFFLQIGIDADVASLVRPSVLGVAAALLAVAVAGKIVAGWAATGSKGDRLLMGLGMVPRGEVGLIFAGIGLREGILDADLYGAVLLVVLATTLVTPPLLKLRLRRVQASKRAVVASVPAPAGGWLVVDDGVVTIRPAVGGALPPPHEALRIGLQAARHLRAARPGPILLDWLGSLGPAPQRWDPAARTELFSLLREGNARSWRFLEVTGLLDRALPELAEAVRRRGTDPFELDPAFPVRFELVDRAQELLHQDGEQPSLAHPERLILATLLVEVGADVAAARQVVKRLDLGAAAEQDVAHLVGESELLRAAAARPDGLGEERVVQIASHLDRPDRARALYLLSLALGDLEPWEQQRLEVLHDLVQAALARPGMSGREARNLIQQRRAAASRIAGQGTAAAERLEHAPHSWLLAHEPEALARMAAL